MNYTIYPIYNGSFTVGMGGAFPDVKNIPTYVFLIVQEGSGQAVLVDTGFSHAFVPGVGSSLSGHRDDILDMALDSLGYAPGDIKTVIMTHLHWDHTGFMYKFPQARFLVQAHELRFLAQLPMKQECSFCPSHWLPHLHQLELVEGSLEIMPGLNLIYTGGHTAGHQVVAATAKEGKIILGGDAPFDYSPFWAQVPDHFWRLFYQGPGEKFQWDDHVRSQLSNYLMNKNSLTREAPARTNLRDLRSAGESFFTSHDPKLGDGSRPLKKNPFGPNPGRKCRL